MLLLSLVKNSGNEVSSLTWNCPASVGLWHSPILALFKWGFLCIWILDGALRIQLSSQDCGSYNFSALILCSCIYLTSSVKKTHTTKSKRHPTNKTQGGRNPDYICGNTVEVGFSVCFLPLNFQVKSPEQGYFEFLAVLSVRFANRGVHLFLNLLWFSLPN